jgi:hypothetical protein
MRLGVRIGEGCTELHDRMMVNLQVGRMELDEAWSYVGKKQRKVAQADSTDKGDQYVFLALEGHTRRSSSMRSASATWKPPAFS